MHDWLETPAEEFCESVRDGTHNSPKPDEDGRYLITSRHIIGDRIDLSNAYLISQGDFDEVNRRSKVDRWDVLITMIGTVGDVCLVREEPNFVIKNIGLFKTKGEKNGKWLYYYLKSPFSKAHIESQKRGTTQGYIPLGALRRFPIKYPKDESLAGAITSLLSSLDDKIDLNRRMNETLEAMARAIFKDWFVDFGPTRAKAEGRAPYLAPELWDLFPDALDDEGKPVGWTFGILTDLADMNPESWSRNNRPEEIEYVDLANTKWGRIEATQRFGWQDAPSRAKRALRLGDTIVGMVRPGNGSFAFIGRQDLTGSTGFAVLRPLERHYRELVYLSATAPENIQRLANLADGAAYPAVRPEIVGATETVLPDDRIINSFSTFVSPIFERIVANTGEEYTLAQTRDLLLPKLMSGEIHLRIAERVTMTDTVSPAKHSVAK